MTRHEHSSRAHFQDVVDLLLGWAMDALLPASARPILVDTLRAFGPVWLERASFTRSLLENLARDLEGLGGSETHNGSAKAESEGSLEATVLRVLVVGACILAIMELTEAELGRSVTGEASALFSPANWLVHSTFKLAFQQLHLGRIPWSHALCMTRFLCYSLADGVILDIVPCFAATITRCSTHPSSASLLPDLLDLLGTAAKRVVAPFPSSASPPSASQGPPPVPSVSSTVPCSISTQPVYGAEAALKTEQAQPLVRLTIDVQRRRILLAQQSSVQPFPDDLSLPDLGFEEVVEPAASSPDGLTTNDAGQWEETAKIHIEVLEQPGPAAEEQTTDKLVQLGHTVHAALLGALRNVALIFDHSALVRQLVACDASWSGVLQAADMNTSWLETLETVLLLLQPSLSLPGLARCALLAGLAQHILLHDAHRQGHLPCSRRLRPSAHARTHPFPGLGVSFRSALSLRR